MSITSPGKYKKPSKNWKLYEKSKKRIHTRSNFVVVFASKFRCINSDATSGTAGDICTSCWTTCKEESGVARSTFDGGWDTRWWQDVDGGAEYKEWVVGVGEDGNLEIHGDVIEDRSGSGMLDGGWNCIWNDCGVSVEENAEVGEVMSLVGLADDMWSEVVLTDEEKSWRKGGDAVNVCDFGGAVGELCKISWCFGLEDVVVPDSDWNEDDWKVVELKEGLTWVRKMVIWSRMVIWWWWSDGDLIKDGDLEVVIWSRMIVASMMMMIMMIVVIIRPAMFQ